MNKLILNVIGVILTLSVIALNGLFAFAISDLPSKYALTLLMLSSLVSVILIKLLWDKN